MVNGFNVTILPDVFNVPELGNLARTRFEFDLRPISHLRVTINKGPNPNNPEIIMDFTPPIPRVLIYTRYGTRVRPTSISDYGRGTTPEDIVGGLVTPKSTTVRFHEGTHGLNNIEFLENNPPPQFTGKKEIHEKSLKMQWTNWLKIGIQK